MSNTDSTNKTSRDRIKLALIPVLGLGLAAVFFWPTSDKAVAIAATNSTARVVSARRATQELKATKSNWPLAQLEDVVAFDPFEPHRPQLPAATSAMPDTADDENSAHEASAKPITLGPLQAVYRDSHGVAAIIDSRVVRVGDVLSDGSRIVEITAQGIIVEM